MSKPLKIFITYSHEDTAAKEELITRLAVMKREGLIDIWHDNEITSGERWRDAIFSNLANSDILFYLVSASSLDSEICNMELVRSLDKNTRVIPIILEHLVIGLIINSVVFRCFLRKVNLLVSGTPEE